jgi:hypothetical protein
MKINNSSRPAATSRSEAPTRPDAPAAQAPAPATKGWVAAAAGKGEAASCTILSAIEAAGYTPGKDMALALDCAASEFYNKESKTYTFDKKTVSGAATTAVATAVVEHTDARPAHQHPALERFGAMMGLGLGVIVTEALVFSKEWKARLVDPQGREVEHIPGADKIGDFDLRKRHEQFVGPKITALVDKLPPGMIHDLVAGLGKGATDAPGASYRLEAGIAGMFKR